MIAAWMLYCAGIGLAFVIAGHALERGLHWAGRPTRWAWCVALAGSLLVPAAAWLVPDAFRALSVPMPAIALPPAADAGSGVAVPAALGGTGSRGLAPSDLDRPLTWSWGLASATLLGALAIAALRLARRCVAAGGPRWWTDGASSCPITWALPSRASGSRAS